MEDKLTNILIIFILIIVIGLAVIYVYKICGITSYDSNTVTTDTDQIIEGNTNEVEENNNSITIQETNTIVVNQITEGNQSETIVIPSTTTNQNTSTNSNQTTTTYEYNNRYYYNQLDSYARIIYDAVADNIENLKYGNYTIYISTDFSSLLSQSDGRSKLDNYYADAINAINLDIPNLFYIDFSKMYLNIETTSTILSTDYKLYINSGEYSTYYSSGFSSQSQIESTISSINKIKTAICQEASGSDYNKVLKVHDWLIDNMSYSSSSYNKGTIYGAFIEKQAVCEGYARAYKYILDSLGITNILVTGTATNSKGITEEHMWNYVELSGTWYAVDVTWDDPIVYGSGIVSYGTKHKYFLMGSTQLYKSHTESKTISSSSNVFTLPTLSVDNY